MWPGRRARSFAAGQWREPGPLLQRRNSAKHRQVGELNNTILRESFETFGEGLRRYSIPGQRKSECRAIFHIAALGQLEGRHGIPPGLDGISEKRFAHGSSSLVHGRSRGLFAL